MGGHRAAPNRAPSLHERLLMGAYFFVPPPEFSSPPLAWGTWHNRGTTERTMSLMEAIEGLRAARRRAFVRGLRPALVLMGAPARVAGGGPARRASSRGPGSGWPPGSVPGSGAEAGAARRGASRPAAPRAAGNPSARRRA